MRRALAALAALAVAAALSGCKPDGVDLSHTPGPGPSTVQVDSPDLEALKAETGMVDCAPGPGGGALPALTLPCLGGGTAVDLSSLKGPMVLNFWGAWCGPCREEMPLLQGFYDQYGEQVPVLGVDWQDRYPTNALKQIRRRDVTYPSVADPGGETQEHEEFAKVPGMPMTYLIDASGKIASVHVGQFHSEQEIVDLVREKLGVAL